MEHGLASTRADDDAAKPRDRADFRTSGTATDEFLRRRTVDGLSVVFDLAVLPWGKEYGLSVYVAKLSTASSARTRNSHQLKSWSNQLVEGKQRIWRYAGDYWSYDRLIGFNVSAVSRGRESVPDRDLRQSCEWVSEVLLEFLFLKVRVCRLRLILCESSCW